MSTVLQITCLSILALLAVSKDEDKCDQTKLVKCFIDNLDEMSNVAYLQRNNLVNMREDDCEHINTMASCLDNDKEHGCSKERVLETSKTLSDLLLHRENSGTFLKSFFLMKYACTENGKRIVSEHRDCLNDERIGKATVAAATYLADKYIEKSASIENSEYNAPNDIESCEMLKTRLGEYNNALKTICNGDASKFMCHSVVSMLQGVYPDKLNGCEFRCEDQFLEEKIGEAAKSNGNGLTSDDGDGNTETQVGSLDSSTAKGAPVKLGLTSIWLLIGTVIALYRL